MVADPSGLHARLAQTLEAEIRAGRYAAGSRLPPHRELMRRYSVSIGTVTKAIDQLSQSGLVRGEVGRGTFVLGDGHGLAAGIVDLSINAPLRVIDQAVFTEAARAAALRCWDLPGNGYGDLAGYPDHRETIAQWVTRTRVAVDADELVLTVGAQQALWLAFAAVGAKPIVTEPLSFPGAIAAAQALGQTLQSVDCDADGLIPAALDKAARGGRLGAIYLTPTAQNPLAFEMPAARRREIAAICKRHKLPIVEDDVYGIYAKSGIPTFRELLPELTYLVGGFSKNLTPLLRVGFIVPPTDARGAVLTRLRAESWGCPPLNTGIVQTLLTGPAERSAVSRLRDEATSRVAIAKETLAGFDVEVRGLSPHVFLRLDRATAERVVPQSLDRGLRLLPLGATEIGTSAITGLRLSVLAPADRGSLTRGLTILRAVLQGPRSAAV